MNTILDPKRYSFTNWQIQNLPIELEAIQHKEILRLESRDNLLLDFTLGGRTIFVTFPRP